MEATQKENSAAAIALIMHGLVENKNPFIKGMENYFRFWCDFGADCPSPVGESQWQYHDVQSLVELALNTASAMVSSLCACTRISTCMSSRSICAR